MGGNGDYCFVLLRDNSIGEINYIKRNIIIALFLRNRITINK